MEALRERAKESGRRNAIKRPVGRYRKKPINRDVLYRGEKEILSEVSH